MHLGLSCQDLTEQDVDCAFDATLCREVQPALGIAVRLPPPAARTFGLTRLVARVHGEQPMLVNPFSYRG